MIDMKTRGCKSNYFTVRRPERAVERAAIYTASPGWPYTGNSISGPNLRELLGKLAAGPIIGAFPVHVAIIS